MKTKHTRKLNKDEQAVLKLLKKADEIASRGNVELSIFGNAGYRFYVIDGNREYRESLRISDFERQRQCIANESVVFVSQSLIGDGGDADFGDATTYEFRD